MHPQLLARADNNIDSECEQQRAADPSGRSIGTLGESPPAAKFDGEAPDQHARRNQLNDAVRPERDECETISRYTRTDRNTSLNQRLRQGMSARSCGA